MKLFFNQPPPRWWSLVKERWMARDKHQAPVEVSLFHQHSLGQEEREG
jgi:hypothetical protein